jgi:hypothetical protein
MGSGSAVFFIFNTSVKINQPYTHSDKHRDVQIPCAREKIEGYFCFVAGVFGRTPFQFSLQFS